MVEIEKIVSGKRCWVSLRQPNLLASHVDRYESNHRFVMVEMDQIVSGKRCWVS
ncbi:MAG: hypothetical protein U7123_27295 [Potamolinea sp.]